MEGAAKQSQFARKELLGQIQPASFWPGTAMNHLLGLQGTSPTEKLWAITLGRAREINERWIDQQTLCRIFQRYH
jgi:hypothetical protein